MHKDGRLSVQTCSRMPKGSSRTLRYFFVCDTVGHEVTVETAPVSLLPLEQSIFVTIELSFFFRDELST